MIKNYFKIAWRNLLKNKGFTAINLSGLAIGMAAVILIGTWIQNELSFERFHANEKSLYKVYNRSQGPGEIYTWDITSGPLGNALAKDFPEVKHTARIYWSTDRLFSYGDKSIKAKGNDVDGSFLSMFSFPLLQGNYTHALDDVNSIVITEKLATNLFGNTDPMNKIIKIDNKDSYKITGVLKNLPSNTEFDFEYLVSLQVNENLYSNNNSWGNNTFYTYVQLQPNTSIDKFNLKIKDEILKYSPEAKTEIFLHPISKWHLYSRFENGVVAGGRIEMVNLVAIIGGLILLIACINFMNLSTAQSQKRANEVGIRKVVGARRAGLIGQFLCESILLSFIAGIIAMAMAALCLPFFNQLLEKSLVINFFNPLLWIGLGSFILLTGLLAGSYPAFMLSSFIPIKVLKGSLKHVTTGFNPRKVLVVIQFSVGIILVVSTMVISRQINFVQSRDTGYQLNQLLEVPIEGDIDKNFHLIKTELLNKGAITAISKTGFGVTQDASNGTGYKWEGMDKESENLSFSIYRTNGDFIKTMGLHLISGRDIDFNQFPSDSTSVMINETALRKTGIKDPVGKILMRGEKPLTIVGVFKDFIIGSPYKEVNPMVVLAYQNYNYNTLLRLNENNSARKNLGMVEQVFKKYNSAYPFSYQFVDEEYAKKFKDEKQIASLSSLFAGLTIFISCLGLFGLAAYMAQNRSKEIGIRKVLGSSIGSIVQLLSKEFVVLVFIAILIAVPISWWAMSKWLRDYTYRIDIGWVSFVLAGLLAMMIAVLTVSYQAIKAALANPVKSLRTQ
ncbi:MAG: ABC transporter permease [Pelobium sp.]